MPVRVRREAADSKAKIRARDYVRIREKVATQSRGRSAQTFLDDPLAVEWAALTARSGMGKLDFLRWVIADAVEHDRRPNKEEG